MMPRVICSRCAQQVGVTTGTMVMAAAAAQQVVECTWAATAAVLLPASAAAAVAAAPLVAMLPSRLPLRHRARVGMAATEQREMGMCPVLGYLCKPAKQSWMCCVPAVVYTAATVSSRTG
jgi:hypothetical protein